MAAVFRSALGAIDNAEAVPLPADQVAGAVEMAALGPGSSDVPRRTLSEAEVEDIVLAEAREREEAADIIAPVDAAAAADRRQEADRLVSLVRRAVRG